MTCAPVGSLVEPVYDPSLDRHGCARFCAVCEVRLVHYEHTPGESDLIGVDGTYHHPVRRVSTVWRVLPDGRTVDAAQYADGLFPPGRPAVDFEIPGFDVALNSTFLPHRPAPCGRFSLPCVNAPPEPPWCCRWPCQLTARGWRCRAAHTVFPFESVPKTGTSTESR